MALTDSLISVWTFDETSGNLIDQYGSNDLTDNNTVTSTTSGYIGGARTFVNANLEYFSKADNADLSTGDIDFEFVARVYFSSLSSFRCIVGKMDGTAQEYQLFYHNTNNRITFGVTGGATSTSVAADALGTPAINTWYTIRAWHDATANEIGIQIDGLTANTAAHTAGVNDSDADFRVGSRSSAVPWYHDGGIDFLAFWKRRLTTDEWADIYNERIGLSFAPSDFGSLPLADVATELITTSGVDAMYQDLTNGAHFRTAIASATVGATTYQVVGYWRSTVNPQLIIAVRDISTSSWTRYIYNGTINSPDINMTAGTFDGHYTVSVGIDPDGYVHVSYGMHSAALLYRKSNAALGAWAGTLTTTLSMLGTNESDVTYPRFFNDPSGNLYFTFREGTSPTDGHLRLYKYIHGTTTWAAAAGTTAGLVVDFQTAGDTAYQLNQPRFDSDFGSGGFMHWGFHPADLSVGAPDSYKVMYVRWDGTNWTQADGTSQTIPITEANGEIADNVAASGDHDTGLVERGVIDSDSDGNPHLVYVKQDGSGYRQIYHAYHNGTSWTITQITSNTSANSGAVAIAIRRSDDSVFIWSGPGYESDNLFYGYQSNQGDYTTWTRITIANTVANGYAFYDRNAFERDSAELHILYCPTRAAATSVLAAGGFPVRLQEYTLPAALGPAPGGDAYQPRFGAVMLGGFAMV